jgi:hypothetical protein
VGSYAKDVDYSSVEENGITRARLGREIIGAMVSSGVFTAKAPESAIQAKHALYVPTATAIAHAFHQPRVVRGSQDLGKGTPEKPQENVGM